MKVTLIILAITVIILHCEGRTSFAQTGFGGKLPKKCSVSGKVGGKYKLLQVDKHKLPEDNSLTILVVIKPENINREYLLKFVERIKQEYCNEPDLIAYIFDDKKRAYYSAVLDYAAYKRADGSYRGSYEFFKDKKIEGIRFSTKRGNSIDEVKIDLKDGKPVNNQSEKYK